MSDMGKGRTAVWVAGVVYVGLILATGWLLSLDTLAQANWIYTATGLVLLTALAVATYGLRVYRQLDELSQRIHLTALAVAFVGTLIVVAGWALASFAGFLDDSILLRRLLSPGPSTPASYYLMGLMIGLYVTGWLWGRSRYR